MASLGIPSVRRRGALAAAGVALAVALVAGVVFLGDGAPTSTNPRPPVRFLGSPGSMALVAASDPAPASAVPTTASTTAAGPVVHVTESGFLRTRRGDLRTIDVPQAEGVLVLRGFAYAGTAVGGSNDRGRIAGTYVAGGTSHGFVLDDGEYRTIDVPGASATTFTDVNNRGEIVGTYTDRRGRSHGFLRSRTGRITVVDVPGAFSTGPHRINDRGQIVGVYSDIDNSTVAVRTGHGFVWQDGHVTTFDAPGGGPLTDPAGINDRGEIVGAYDDAKGVTHGFLRTRRGHVATIDVPGAAFTSLTSINDRGDIVGQTATPADLAATSAHGVVLRRGSTDAAATTLIDVPNFPIAAAADIDGQGRVVGFAYRLG